MLINLTTLYLSKNQIIDLTPLSNLINLKVLDLSNNQISDLTGLSNLINLEYLDLSENQINSDSLIRCPLSNLINNDEINISAFLVIYSRNPTHPLVKSIPLEEFDENLQKQLLDDLNITEDFQEGNISFIIND